MAEKRYDRLTTLKTVSTHISHTPQEKRGEVIGVRVLVRYGEHFVACPGIVLLQEEGKRQEMWNLP